MKDLKALIAKPRHIALYSMAEGGSLIPLQVSYADYDENLQPLPAGERRERPVSGFVRVTEPVEMTFRAIDDETMVRNAVAALNEEERKVLNELNIKLADIRERKSQLLALTHQVESA